MRTFVTPGQLKAQLEKAADALPLGAFIRDPRNQYLKDTWCAAHFGLGYEQHIAPCMIWVNAEQNSETDFVFKVGNKEFSFQTTLSDVPGRRMGDEHKVDPSHSCLTRPYEPGRGSVEGPQWIASAVRRKVATNYSTASQLNLLVYANFETNGLDYNAVRQRAQPLFGAFASIWLITNHQICSISPSSTLGELTAMHSIYDLSELLQS
jgi:hypothetical protein